MTKPSPVGAERRLKNYRDAATYLSISVRGFQDLVSAGEVMKVPVGHRVLFDKVDLDAFIERQKKRAS